MIVTTVVPDGIVMAADSALATFKMMDMINLEKGNLQAAVVNTFNGTYAYDKKNIIGTKIMSRTISKLYVMKGNNIAIANGNQTGINNKSIIPYINYFCQNNQYDDPKSCAVGLFEYIKKAEPNIKALFHVCGYNHVGNIPVPEFWFVDIEKSEVLNAAGAQYGISIGGANEYFFKYVPLINKGIMSYSLQDAIDVSMFAIYMSIKLERFIDREELILPPIDLLVIEPSGVKWIQQKTLKAEGFNGYIC
jgi:hypothetical protein